MKHLGSLTAWLLALITACASTPPLIPIPASQPFTFAVLGDNRGDDSGEQPPTFGQILRAMDKARPAFAVNTGDMIYGHSADEALVREQWRLYHEAVATCKTPLLHVPGNHDIWNEMSARVYRERCGPAYFAFDYGRARFIGLDSETVSSRLGPEQLEWLRKQLEEAGQRILFVFLHRPLFPVDGAIGTSMDAYPGERDQLHQLFIRYRHAIKGVFLGHEHLYHFQARDGVPYYITGGGGAPLYVAPELGGFHHYLLVRVGPDEVTTELRKVGAPANLLLAAKRVARGQLLESWEQGLFWQAWNYTVTTELTSGQASEGRRGLQLNFDLAQCPWPVLSLSLPSPWNLRDCTALWMDVFVPAKLKARLWLTPNVETREKHEAIPVKLKPGWNTVRADLHGPWLPIDDRGPARELGWSLAAEPPSAVRDSIIFDNFRVERRPAAALPAVELRESWERPWLWRVVDESVKAETTPQLATAGKRGLKVCFDFSQCLRPTLLARLNPPWNLGGVDALAVDVFVPDDLTESISLSLALRTKETGFTAPPATLQHGWNQVKVQLIDGWLPQEARVSADQVEWILESPSRTLQGWVVFDNLRTQ